MDAEKERAAEHRARAEFLVDRLESLAANGIFPQARAAAYSLLQDYRLRFDNGEGE